METPTTDYSKLSTRELYELTAKAEGYESVPVDIDTFLNDPYYLGQTYDNGKAVYEYWREALHRIYPNPLYSPYEEVCLSGDTTVDLLDGRSLTMAEICEMGPDAVFWVLAFNVNTRQWEPCKAGAPKMTGIKPVYKITLDNGKAFKATGNHKVLGKDNRWHRADSLKVGQSLMPYNLTYDDAGYAYAWDHSSQTSVKRARLVQQWKNKIPTGWHTHHKNQIRQDDRPANIIALHRDTHIELHGRMFHKNKEDPITGRVIRSQLSDAQARARKNDPAHYTAINYNHRIVSIEILPPEPVYNFTVDRLHNYTLSCGVISSNCVTGCIGAGKAVTVDTRVLTESGYKRAADITISDRLLGTDGEFHRLDGIFPQGKKHCWKFYFNDRSSVTTSDGHIWTVATHGPRSPLHKWQDTTTADIVAEKIKGRWLPGGKRGKLFIPVLKSPAAYPEKSLPFDPYMFGLLLADGSLTNFSISLPEKDIYEKFSNRLAAIGGTLTGPFASGYDYRIKGVLHLIAYLRDRKLGVRDEKRYIPEDYLLASPKQRLELLQGLFDGDGYVGSSYYEITSVSSQLAEDVVFLIESLGGRATRCPKRTGKYRLPDGTIKECQEFYKISFTMPSDLPPFSSEKHKSRRENYKQQNEPYKKIMSWEDAGEHECVCFSVDSPDHLFAVEDFTFTHNTSFAIMGAMYDLYHVCLLREPQRKYKLLRTTRILFSLVTATKDLASAVMANQMLDVIAASPFFTSRFMPKKGEKLDEDMFPHHVGVGFGSRGGHNLGKAVIGAIIDEANFQEAVANQAVKNYETITRRMSSRFKLKNGSLPCRRWLVSSRNSDSSFLESHIEAVKDNPKVLVLAPAIWDVQKEKGIYSGKTFPVFIGTNTQQPMICTTEKEVEDHAGYIIEVPDIYREEFEENLPGALMDLAGVANRSSMSLIYNVEKWVDCQCLDNAIAKDEIILSIDGADKIMDYMVRELPKYNYYVHLDGALKGDRFGFAMSAIEKQMTVSGRNLLTGEQTLRLSPSLITPIVFGIKARPGSEVPLWKVRQFLLDLRNKGVCIMQVSTDGFQSADMRQMLEKMGFNVKYVSVDTTKDPYLKFASNINHGLMKVPKSPILDFEVRYLENRDKKIDHPDKVMVNGRYVKGSKDIADAVSASQHEALLASLSLSAGTLVEQLGETQHLSTRGRQEYVQDMIFSMVQGNPDKHIAGGMY